MNGWKNYETWNVSLWIQNDETLYRLALASAGFQTFLNDMLACGCPVTPDGVKWTDADYSEVQSMFNEMHATTDLQYWGQWSWINLTSKISQTLRNLLPITKSHVTMPCRNLGSNLWLYTILPSFVGHRSSTISDIKKETFRSLFFFSILFFQLWHYINWDIIT